VFVAAEHLLQRSGRQWTRRGGGRQVPFFRAPLAPKGVFYS
jgi:hypothetical protein